MVKKLLQDEKLYFVAIVPAEPILSELWGLKEYFRDKYDSSKSLNSPPHITLHMPFKWREGKEERLQRALQECCEKLTPFNLTLNGFGAFPPRVIYVQPDQSDELFLLQKTVARALRLSLNIFNADYQNRGFHPHITLAFRDLKKTRFPEAWQEFENKPFAASFPIHQICLLKHNGIKWEVYCQLPFGLATSAGTNEHLSEGKE